MDIDSIPLGVDYVEHLEAAVSQCDVLLCLVGKNWIDVTDEAGSRRLDKENDFVRVEVRKALADKKLTVPIFIDGVQGLDEAKLPPDLKPLSRRQAEFLEFSRFDSDIQRIFSKLQVPEALIDTEEGDEDNWSPMSGWEKLSWVWDDITARLELLIANEITDGRSLARYNRIPRTNYADLLLAAENDGLISPEAFDAFTEINSLFLSWRSRNRSTPDDVGERAGDLWDDYQDVLPDYDDDESE